MLIWFNKSAAFDFRYVTGFISLVIFILFASGPNIVLKKDRMSNLIFLLFKFVRR